MTDNEPTPIRPDTPPAQVVAAMAMRTPCCGASFSISYTYEGRAYMQEQVVDGFECDGRSPEGGNCYNQWHANGTPSYIAVPDSEYGAFSFEEDGSVAGTPPQL